MNKSRPRCQRHEILPGWQRRSLYPELYPARVSLFIQIITLGKKGNAGAQSRASAFLLKPDTITKLFTTFAKRYADRPGGYTRIHKFGNRQGDNAPHAILELVDNPRDLRWEMTSRAVGWELLRDKLRSQRPEAIMNAGVEKTMDVVQAERKLDVGEKGVLRPKTRWNLQKILRYRSSDATQTLSEKAAQYAVCFGILYSALPLIGEF